MKRKILALVLVLMLAVFSSAVFAADQTIVEIAVESDDFTVLVAALQKAELVDTLSGDGPFTVFAPTDAAFTKLLTALGITADDLLNHPQLAEVLTYHVVSGKVMSTDLTEGMTPTTLQGETLAVSLDGGVTINDSNVTTADVEATNGVIHIIDTVLVPDSFVLDAADDGADDDDAAETGDAGLIPFFLTAAIGATGMIALKKRSKR